MSTRGWSRYELDGVCSKITDGSHNPPRGIEQSDFIMLSSKNVFDDRITFDKPRFLSEKDFLSENRRTSVEAGDVLLTIVGTIGRVAVVPKSVPLFTLQRSVAVLKVNKEIAIPRLLMFLLQSLLPTLIEGARGVAQKGIYLRSLRSLSISLPPLREQKQIVAILDKAFAAIDQAVANAELNLTNARELFESYLNKVFTERGEGWSDMPVASISDVINGFAFKSGQFSSTNVVKSIKITNVGVKEFVYDDSSLLPEGFDVEYSAVRVPEGSLVIALTRSIISTGLKVAVVPKEFDGALLNQRVAALLADETKVIQNYLYAYLCTNQVSDYVKKQANTLMQPNLSIRDLRKLLVPIAPLIEQQEIVDRVGLMTDKIGELETIYQQKLTALTELKQSILQKAFRGELTAGDSYGQW